MCKSNENPPNIAIFANINVLYNGIERIIDQIITLALKDNEANSKHPVSVENCIMPAFALGGCNDYALLGTLDRKSVV